MGTQSPGEVNDSGTPQVPTRKIKFHSPTRTGKATVSENTTFLRSQKFGFPSFFSNVNGIHCFWKKIKKKIKIIIIHSCHLHTRETVHVIQAWMGMGCPLSFSYCGEKPLKSYSWDRLLVNFSHVWKYFFKILFLFMSILKNIFF